MQRIRLSFQRPHSKAALLAASAALLAGCPRSTPPSSGVGDAGGAGSAAVAPTPAPTHAASALVVETAPRDQIAPAPKADGGAPGYAGASWETCYAGYEPEGIAAKDVLRLGLLCGPYHGMREVQPRAAGRLEADGVDEHAFHVEQGQCFRVVAVADAALAAIQVEVADPAGAVVERSAPSRWSVAPARGLWCAERAGEASVRVKAVGGAGEFALRLWLLP